MPAVREPKTTRLLIACTLVPAASIREDWTRSLFETLQDEFPQLLGTPIIIPDRAASFLRPAAGGVEPRQVCQIAGDSVVVGADLPSEGDMDALPKLALRAFELARRIYHTERVARVGRVQLVSWTLDPDGGSSELIRDGLTVLKPEEASDLELQITRRDGIFNVNLKLSPASSSDRPGPSGLPVRDVLLTQSDVNNWDTSGDVSGDLAGTILARGARHAQEEVPAFLRDKLRLQLEEV